MSKKKRWVGARKALEQLDIVRVHYAKAIQLIDEYGLRDDNIDNSDCICDLAQLEEALYEIEGEEP